MTHHTEPLITFERTRNYTTAMALADGYVSLAEAAADAAANGWDVQYDIDTEWHLVFVEA